MPSRLSRLLPVAGIALVAMAVWRAPEVPAAPKPLDGEVRYLRIAAGPATTASFAGGSALASAVTRPPGLPPCGADGACGVSGLVALVQSVPGPDAVVAAVAAGRIDSGLAPADAVLAARCAGTAELSVIANLYREALHVAVRPGLEAASVADLKGKRVAIGAAGSAERRLADRVLTAHGLKRRDVRFVELSGAEAAEALAEGGIDALFRLSPWPDAELSGLAERGEARLLPVAGEGAERLMALAPFDGPVTLPDGLYAGSGVVATLSQPVQWIATPALEPALLAKLSEALARPQNRTLLRGPDEALPLAEPTAAPLACPGG